MTTENETPNTPKDHNSEANEALDRRQFIVGTAVVAATASGLVACDAEAKVTKEPATAGDKATDDKNVVAKTEAPTDEAKDAPPAKDDAPAEEPAEAPEDKKKPEGGKGRIVQVTHSGATTKITKTDEAVVKSMVEEVMKKFTGEKDLPSALAKYFKKDDVVGIKINTLGSPYASVHPATAFAFADGLHAMGIPKGNIYIYDQYGSRMRKGKFRPLREKQKAKEGEYPVHNHETLGYQKDKVDLGGFFKHKKKKVQDNGTNYPTGMSQLPVLLGKLTAVLNLCCVKDHDLTGVTGALKNVSYGNIEFVPKYHCIPDCNPKCVHKDGCNVAKLYSHAEFGGKVRLVACDALRVLFQGGPQDNMTFKKAHNAIMVSTDPVAIDRAILEIVNTYRKERKLKPIEEDAGGRRAPRFLAAAAKMGLGEADLAKIKWEKHEMG